MSATLEWTTWAARSTGLALDASVMDILCRRPCTRICGMRYIVLFQQGLQTMDEIEPIIRGCYLPCTRLDYFFSIDPCYRHSIFHFVAWTFHWAWGRSAATRRPVPRKAFWVPDNRGGGRRWRAKKKLHCNWYMPASLQSVKDCQSLYPKVFRWRERCWSNMVENHFLVMSASSKTDRNRRYLMVDDQWWVVWNNFKASWKDQWLENTEQMPE